MAIFIPDFTLEGLNSAQTLEVLNALQHIYNTSGELQTAIDQSVQNYADYEVLFTEQGRTFIDTGTRLMGEYTGPTSSAASTALEMAEDAYDVTILDKLGNVKAQYSSAQGAMGTAGGAGVAQATSLMSLDVGMVGAAVAPLLGVSLGAGLYEINPNLWTKISQALVPFCYGETYKIPAWMDIVEDPDNPGTYIPHTVIDKRIYDAVKQLFDEEGIGEPGLVPSTADIHTRGDMMVNSLNNSVEDIFMAFQVAMSNIPNYSFEFDSSALSDIRQFVESNNNCGFFIKLDTLHTYSDWSNAVAYLTAKPLTVGEANFFTGVEGPTEYLFNLSFRGNKSSPESTHIVLTSQGIPQGRSVVYSYIGQGLYNIRYWVSTVNANVIRGYPEGTSAWRGDSYALELYEKSIIHFIPDPNNPGKFIPEENDGIEITAQKKNPQIPEDKPYPSVDPNLEPNPGQTSDPSAAISNLINSAPGTETNPAEDPQPDPSSNPSIPNKVIAPVIPIDPPGPGGTEPPPPDDGSGPASLIPSIPLPFSSLNDGLISVYHPTDAQLKAFASWLWVTYADPSIEKLWNNPFDGVIGLMEIYCTPTDNGTKTIRSGFLDSGVSSATISRYTEINCGTVFVPEYYRNYFDYSPYSKCHIYLPFIGIVELNVDDVVGHGINCTYKIDEYNGSCIAQLRMAKYTEVNEEPVTYDAIMYQFSGNCAVELPLAGGTQAAIRAGMIQAAAYGLSSVVGGIVSGVSGNIGGAISQVGYGAANAIGSLVSAKSSVQHSGSFGSSFGALGCKTPYIIVSRPKQISVYNYPELYGYPAHCAVTIGACSGFLRVREVNVRSSTATDEEKAKIEELLKEGVYV